MKATQTVEVNVSPVDLLAEVKKQLDIEDIHSMEGDLFKVYFNDLHNPYKPIEDIYTLEECQDIRESYELVEKLRSKLLGDD